MEFDFSKCDAILTQKRINEIRNRVSMYNSIKDLFCEDPGEYAFLENMSDSRLLDYALFNLRCILEGEIEKYDIHKILETIFLNGEK